MPAETQRSLTFIGTATTILRLGAFTVLTDPNFLRKGQRAYLGRGLWSRRLTDPAAAVDHLPPLDAVVLSHLHGDHWDRVARKALLRTPPVLTTPHAARRIQRQGFDVAGLEDWTEHTLTKDGQRLTVTALPGVHARGALGKLLPPVMGAMLEHQAAGETRRIYVSGDTLTGRHLAEIRERFPDIDVAVMHLGGTRILGATVTMDDRQGVDFLRLVQPKSAVPVHYDDYGVFKSPLSAFLTRAGTAYGDALVRPVQRGETLTFA